MIPAWSPGSAADVQVFGRFSGNTRCVSSSPDRSTVPAVRMVGLRKAFGSVVAVDGIDLALPELWKAE